MSVTAASGLTPSVGPWPRVQRPGRVPESKFVYAAERDGRIKIGIAVDVPARMYTLGAALLAAIPGNYRDEQALHRRFTHLRIQGEWYTDCEELRSWISTLPSYGALPSVGRSGVYGHRGIRK